MRETNHLNALMFSTACAEVENIAFSHNTWILSPRNLSMKSIAVAEFPLTNPQFPRPYYDEFVFLL